MSVTDDVGAGAGVTPEEIETEELRDARMTPVRIVQLGAEPSGGDKGPRLVIFQTPAGSAKVVLYEDGRSVASSREHLIDRSPRPLEDALIEVINDLYCQLFGAKVLLEHAQRLIDAAKAALGQRSGGSGV